MKVEEKQFDLEYINKYASQMTIGNGFFGIRGSQEEDYRNQVRGMFAAGVYNRPLGAESAELVNLPDVIRWEIKIDGEHFSLETMKVLAYERALDLEMGELKRYALIETAQGKKVEVITCRVADQNNLHQAALKVVIKPLTEDCQVDVKTGIDGQQTNFGTQQLVEKELRVFGDDLISASYQTTESKIDIGIAAKFNKAGVFQAKNRRITASFSEKIRKNTSFTLEKIIVLSTSLQQTDPFKKSIAQAQKSVSYTEILEQSMSYWTDFWHQHRITIQGDSSFDQLAMDFAAYHLQIMTPRNDPSVSVGAKGLTGEGYKGHVFWDTEIFILPFFLYQFPEVAKNLLLYRYDRLEGARQKARDYHYQGALFPWESAHTGQEETPKFAALNIKTETRQEVASAAAEHHISADLAYAVQEYVQATEDQSFLETKGKTLIHETAAFWLSRAVKVDDHLEIHRVIGPDEYTEYIDNNAYTNYLAHYNVALAVKYQAGDPLFLKECQNFLDKLYLPVPNKEQLIPQDDTYLSKPVIDLTTYKERPGSQSILLDYARSEVNELQVSKQADLVMLLYLLPEYFSQPIVSKNLHYYENKTIHDSSLSKAIHAIEACRIQEMEWAYHLFQEACLIDLGPDPHSSDDGIHAASLGALWLAVIFGFSGITVTNGTLSISPRLPSAWEKISFPFIWKNHRLLFVLTKKQIVIKKETKETLPIFVNGDQYQLEKELILERRGK